MTEDIAKSGAQDGKLDGHGQSEKMISESAFKTRLNEVISQREEYKEELAKQAKTLAELQASIKSKEDASLAEQGKFKTLYETEKESHAKALAQVESVKAYQDKVKALAEAEKTALPESLKDLVPEGDSLVQLDYIAKLKLKPELWPDGKVFNAGKKPNSAAAATDDEKTVLKKQYESLTGKNDRQSQELRIAIKNRLCGLGVNIQ